MWQLYNLLRRGQGRYLPILLMGVTPFRTSSVASTGAYGAKRRVDPLRGFIETIHNGRTPCLIGDRMLAFTLQLLCFLSDLGSIPQILICRSFTCHLIRRNTRDLTVNIYDSYTSKLPHRTILMYITRPICRVGTRLPIGVQGINIEARRVRDPFRITSTTRIPWATFLIIIVANLGPIQG